MSIAMFGLGIVFTRGGPVQPVPLTGRTPGPTVVATTTGGSLASTATALQEHLRRLPADHPGWASLGTVYVQQAAVTGDPTYYSKAAGALRRSLQIQPDANASALTGLAALAAARHDFPKALARARVAQRINPYSATNRGVLSDSLQQLGRYRQADKELQRMLDLRPGVESFTRASYAFELRGQRVRAESALRRALEVADRPSDKAFCLYYLGELAWNAGDLDRADHFYRLGLRQERSYTPLLAGRARVAAARGDIASAVESYATVVERQPVPSHLIAFSDLLRSLGRDRQAARQEAVVAATEELFESQGANVDLELALFHADRGASTEALSAARSAWRGQRSVEAADAYAWALHSSGSDQAALRYSNMATRLGTRSALFAYHRGVIEKALGMPRRAAASLRRALDLNPHFSPLLEPRARAALDELRTR